MNKKNLTQKIKDYYNELVAKGELTAKQAKKHYQKKIRALSTITPVSYFGAKSKLSDFIYSLFPKDKNLKVYIECFSGAFGVYFKEDMSQFDTIIFNDLNFLMTNLVSCFQRPEEFRTAYEELSQEGGELYFDQSMTFEERDDYFRIVHQCYKEEVYSLSQEQVGLYNFSIAVKFAFLMQMTYNSCSADGGGGYRYGETNKGTATKLGAIINKLDDEAFIEKVKCITHFYSMDFEELLDMYDSEETMVYSDSPYYSFEKEYSVGDEESFGVFGHIRLAKLAKRFKGKIALSYYYFKAMDYLYPKDEYNWYNFTFDTTAGKPKDGELNKGNEILITNY